MRLPLKYKDGHSFLNPTPHPHPPKKLFTVDNHMPKNAPTTNNSVTSNNLEQLTAKNYPVPVQRISVSIIY